MAPEPVEGSTAMEALAESLSALLRSFNDERSPAHLAVRPAGALRRIGFGLRGDAGWVGGVYGELYWGWLEVVRLYVPAGLRGRGLGSELLRRVEDAARSAGCTRSHLRTYSFQAPGFYERHGYSVIGRLEDYPPGQSFLWMRKELDPA